MEIDYADLICKRLNENKDHLREDFLASGLGYVTKHLAVDNLLPEDVALELFELFPATNTMRNWSDFRERKSTTRNMDEVHPKLFSISKALQDSRVVNVIEKITNIEKQLADETFYAGGLSAMEKGSFLSPHIDNSHDKGRNLYRRINLLYYISPNWKAEWGGNLELWDESVKKKVVVPSFFNRLVIMETTNISWHSVEEVLHDKRRCCVSSYFFTKKSPLDHDYFHITRFGGRPEERFRRVWFRVDAIARTLVRKVLKGGLAKKDIYTKL